MTKGGAGQADSAEVVQTASAPPSESKRGGCAGCTTSTSTPNDLAFGALAFGALALVMRRRKRAA